MLDGTGLLRQKRDEVPEGTLSCPDRNLAVFHHYRHYEGLRLLPSAYDSKLIQQTLVREFNASHPEIPWKQVEGMRHDLVHGYSQVLPRILWATAKENIPEIKAKVEKYLNEIDWEHYCGE